MLTFISCTQEDETPTTPIQDDYEPAEATLLKEGDFENVAHIVTGKAKIYSNSGASTVVLDPFSTEKGPDLYVYLSDDQQASNFVSLGELKSTKGKQSYEIPEEVDLDDYSYVLIWCQEFSVNFGQAEMK